MDIINNTPFEYGTAIGMGPNRTLLFSIVLKGTFTIPKTPGEVSALAEVQVPIRDSDEFPDGDVTIPLRFEAENVPYKEKADLVCIGKAYAPPGEMKRAVDVMFRVGRNGKILRVFGDRKWVFPTRVAVVPLISDPEPFQTLPITYDRAFGGIDKKAGKWSPYNLQGKGFIGKKNQETVHELALPNIEDPKNLISSWDDHPLPVGLGYFDKGANPRVGYMGRFSGAEDPADPIQLPHNFNPLFYNAAHPELQVKGYLDGTERVELRNITPERRNEFNLPGVNPTITIRKYSSPPDFEDDEAELPSTEPVDATFNLDTFLCRPDDHEYELIWRASVVIPDLENILISSVVIDS